MEVDHDGLLRDQTRPARNPSFGVAAAERIGALTLQKPTGEATQRTGTDRRQKIGSFQRDRVNQPIGD